MRTIERMPAQLWGGRYDGAQALVTLELGEPGEVVEWPDNQDPPPLDTLLGLLTDPTLDDSEVLRFRLDPSFQGGGLLYRLEKQAA